MKTSFPDLVLERHALFRIAEPAQRQLAKLLFHRHPNREWGTFFRFGYRRTQWGLALSFVDALPPIPGELDRRSPIVTFNTGYISRMLDERDRSRLGIGFVHSHPLGWGVTPSPSDDDMDTYFAGLGLPYGTGQPYVSLIMNLTANGEWVISGRVFDRGEWMSVHESIIPGRALRRYCNPLLTSKPRSVTDSSDEDVLARWSALVGKDISARCAHTIVGVVGCSGTGSPAVEALARAQIGHFILVDSQRLSKSNLERVHGSRASDLLVTPPPYKVEVMARMIHEINPSANVVGLVGNSLDDSILDELLRCDVVLGCTDTVHGRAMLGDLASLYLVPALDVGVLPRGKNGRVSSQLVELTRLGVTDPCPYCLGRISTSTLNVELMSEEDRNRSREAATAAIKRGEDGSLYWNGEPPPLPTVGYLTTMAGSLAAGYALNWLLGTGDMPHNRFQFDIGSPEFAFVADTAARKSDCGCTRWHGHGGQGERSVTLPLHFPRSIRVV